MSRLALLRRGRRLVRSWLAARLDQDRSKHAEPRRPRHAEGNEVSPRGVRRDDVEGLLGTPVGDLLLYEHALRHRSIFRGEQTDGTESNERLEFLGDAVLGAVVAERLYVAFPDENEGILTRTRANLVNGTTLARFARSLDLGALILMSDNMAASGGRDHESILADTFEAIVGALYLDLGFPAARRFVFRVLDRCVSLETMVGQRSNFKSLLLEYVQARALPQPRYEVVAEEGPSHERLFTVQALVDGTPLGQGEGRSKKAAEQAAAEEALSVLRHRDLSDSSTDATTPSLPSGTTAG